MPFGQSAPNRLGPTGHQKEKPPSSAFNFQSKWSGELLSKASVAG